MIAVEFLQNGEYAAYCRLQVGAERYYGGVTKGGEIFRSGENPYPELMLRALVNKCMTLHIKEFYTEDVWGADLARFGFTFYEGRHICLREHLKLPHDCKNEKKYLM